MILRSPYTSAIIDTYQQNGRISSESKRLQHPSEQKIRRKTWMKIDIRKICELEQKILSYAPSKKHDKFAIETITAIFVTFDTTVSIAGFVVTIAVCPLYSCVISQ